jgi:hypothetical protein
MSKKMIPEEVLNSVTEGIKLSDTEMERWVRESYMEKKGFISE